MLQQTLFLTGTISTAEAAAAAPPAAASFHQQEPQLQHEHDSDVWRRVRNVDDTSIRSWGCGRQATPLIFVHIGKAGGGNIRTRIAAAAHNVTRSTEHWRDGRRDEHYYPLAPQRHAKFCNSGRLNHRPTITKSFEGTLRCTATTPLGHILACPDRNSRSDCPPVNPLDPNSAHLVYVGHNLLGTELHWLPVPYLQDWWNEHWSSAHTEEVDDTVLSMMAALDGIRPWCQDLPRLLHLAQNKSGQDHAYWNCSRTHVEPRADALAEVALARRHIQTDGASARQRGRAYGHLYATLPVTRVTVLREPLSWLLSKWSWHILRSKKKQMPCDDINLATQRMNDTSDDADDNDDMRVRSLHNVTRPGWLRIMSLQYIMYLCGEDCYVRWEMGTTSTSLEELEAQAAYNLRNSFAVVGLLHEQDSFFEMLHERVQYMDLKLDHAEEFGENDHPSPKDYSCEERFRDEQFKKELVASSLELQALMRLYEIGVEVNRFQMRELEECSGRALAVEPRKRTIRRIRLNQPFHQRYPRQHYTSRQGSGIAGHRPWAKKGKH